MSSLGIPIGHLLDPFERRRQFEYKLHDQLKFICNSDLRRYTGDMFLFWFRNKALASTGYKNEIEAVKWLLSHASDPLLDEPCHREISLFLCVRSDLAAKIQEFWSENGIHESWNHANEFPPHITLLSNIKVTVSWSVLTI